jgi:response regulator of citrate/malate metabolism
MLPAMRERLEYLNNQLEGMGAEARDLAAAIAKIESGETANNTITARGEPRRRLPKGQAKKTMRELLKMVPKGQGLTVAEIASKTGIKYISVYRTLYKNKEFLKEDGKWRLK